MALDLTKLPAYYLSTYGADKVAEITGALPSTIAAWARKDNSFSLAAVQALLDFDPAPLKDITPHYALPELGKKLVILVPLAGPPAPKMVDSLMRLHDRREMAYERIAFNCLSVSRNALAARFLRGPYEWAFWQDGDSLLPAGDAAWFKEAAELRDMPDAFAGNHTIYSLLSHRVKWGKPEATIVSCVYVGRANGAPPQFGGGHTPEMRALIRRGPQNKLIEVPWVGFGGVLTHRSVFESIIETQGPELKMKPGGIGSRFGYEYGFFNPLDGETIGDDLPFCARARKAGHKIFIDLAVMGAHVGDRPFTYRDI